MKSNLEKAKQALEKETSELTMEVRSLAQAKQDGEHRRKKLEGQVADLQSRFSDSEKQKAELGERCSKITVNHSTSVLYMKKSVHFLKARVLKCKNVPENSSLSSCRLNWRV